MKKLLMTAFVTGILFFMPAAEAEIETYVGEGKATMSEDETQEKTINRAKTYALRHAQEQAGVYIRSQSRMRDLELVDDDVETITGGIVKITDTQVEKSLSGDVIQIHVTVTVQIDSEALQREIERRLDKQRSKPVEEPGTPIDRPKPLDEPKPPVAQPKPVEHPAPVVQPKPPVEEPKPVEPPAPTLEPPPVAQPEPIEPIEPIKPPTPVEPVTPPVTEPSSPWLTDEQIMTGDLLDLINAEREKAGKKPLTRNSVLVKGAKVRVEELTRKWSDKRPNGQGWWTVLPPAFQQKSSWEYIHSGYDTPQKILDWYLAQKDVKILNAGYQNIGIGYFYKADSEDKHYWVVILS